MTNDKNQLKVLNFSLKLTLSKNLFDRTKFSLNPNTFICKIYHLIRLKKCHNSISCVSNKIKIFPEALFEDLRQLILTCVIDSKF